MTVTRYGTNFKAIRMSSLAAAITAGEIAADTITASQIAADAVGASEIAANAVAASELAAAVIAERLVFACTKPAVIEELASQVAQVAMTASKVKVRCGTLPTGATDAFSLNVRNGTVGNIFASNQVFAREPDVTGFLKTTDNEVGFTSYLTEVTGAGVAALGALDTAANGDYFYAGYTQPFAGVRIDMDGANVNANAATITVQYWDGSAWQAAANVTDGTVSAGATLAQDGTIVWDTPVTWTTKTINATSRYWIRFSVSAALSATVNVDNADIIRDTGTYYEFTPDQNLTIAAGALVVVHCTEADANADGLTVIVEGTNDF